MPKGRILVVDKSEDFLTKTGELLNEAGYDMIPATDAAKASALVASRKVDGVISALFLPGELSGAELCRELRKRDESVPCYLMVAADDPALVEQAIAAGARNVLVRPLKRTELLFAARALMNLRSLLRARTTPPPAPGRAPTSPPVRAPAARAPSVPPTSGVASGPAGPDDRALFFQFELFKRLLAIELKRAKRYDFPLSLLLVSPDGEPAAPLADGAMPVPAFDADATTACGRAVAEAIRDIDIPMHFPDDNILVVMPHTELDGAMVVAERIRRKARSGPAAITVSIGASSIEGLSRPSFDQLVNRATRALSEARRAGGDRVEKT